MTTGHVPFEQQAEEVLAAIEEAVEESGADIDFENNSGVLTLICEDTNTQVIVSRQVAKSEIWVAARSGGFHCAQKDSQWRCTTTDETLQQLLSRVCSEQSDGPVNLDFTL